MLLGLLVVGCPRPGPSSPAPCPDGMRRAEDPAYCEPMPPTCAEGTVELVPGDGCTPLGWTDCPAGFGPDPSGWGCADVLPDAGCGPGTMPVLGQTACAPVGWTECGPGFQPDSSGWGCAPVLPVAACAGATYEVLGQTACQPLGDCAAAFPPAAATLFVDDSYSAGQLDSTHFSSIGAALSAAPAGATVAVEAGAYSGGLVLPRAVKLVGRCAEQVTLTGTAAGVGLDASGVSGVEVDGLTVTGFDLGAYVDGAGSLELRHCRFDGNVRSAVQALGAGTLAKVSASVLRGTLPDALGRFGEAVSAAGGARVEVSGSALVGNSEMAVLLTGTGTVGQLTGLLVAGTKPRASGKYGWGVAAQSGAEAHLEACAVLDNRVAGLLASVDGHVWLSHSLVAGTKAGLDNGGLTASANLAVEPGGALEVSQSGVLGAVTQVFAKSSAGATARLTLTDALVRAGDVDPTSEAVHVESGSTIEATRTAVVAARGVGLFLWGSSTATLVDVLIQGTVAAPSQPNGRGLSISGSTLSASRVALLDNANVAAYVSGGGSATFERCLFGLTRPGPTVGGDMLGAGLVVDAQAQADVKDSVVADNSGVGVDADGAGSSVRLRGTLVRGTRLGPSGNGQGVVAQYGALVLLDGVGLVGNRAAGLQATDSGSLVKATRTLVRGTLPGEAGNRGRGANVQGGARLELLDSALVDNRQVGLFAWGAGTRVFATDSLVGATAVDPDGSFGHGVEALDAARVDLRGSSVRGNAGVGLVAAGAAATVVDGKLEANLVGLQAQDGSSVQEVDEVLEPVGVTEVLVTATTVFVDNATRLGAGSVPLPER